MRPGARCPLLKFSWNSWKIFPEERAAWKTCGKKTGEMSPTLAPAPSPADTPSAVPLPLPAAQTTPAAETAALSALEMAAQGEMHTAMRKHLTCAVCIDLFDEPLSLPCQHTFCKKCIYQHFNLGGQTCPSCRAPAWKRQAAPNHMVAGLVATLLK